MRVQRGDLGDVWSDGTRTAVFVDGHVLVLSEIASAILTALPEGETATLTEITAAVVAAVGAPPTDPEPVVAQQIDDLVANKVLVRASPVT